MTTTGQVMPILKTTTACYECFPKPTQKVYPICTIRSTPDKPVHCIVWAKECFKLMFGNATDSMLYEDEANTGESSTYMSFITSGVPLPLSSSSSSSSNSSSGSSEHKNRLLEYGHQLLNAMFHHEIVKRIDMDVYKTAKSVPKPLDLQLIKEAVAKAKDILGLATCNDGDDDTTGSSSGTFVRSVAGTNVLCSTISWEQSIFTIEQNIIQFLLCLYDISVHADDSKLIGQLSFDKDDVWAMKFVTVTSNMRSSIFTIPLQSYHDAKGIAGNIIPAIATTNAIIASIQVQQAINVIININKNTSTNTTTTASTEEDVTNAAVTPSSSSPSSSSIAAANQIKCSHVYCLRLPTRKGYYLQPCTADKPVPSCYVCGTAEVHLQIDINQATLGDILTRVIKSKLGFNEPSIMHGSTFLYEEGDGADEDLVSNLTKTLIQCKIADGSQLVIEDFSQNLEVRMIIKHVDVDCLQQIPTAAEDLFILNGQDALEMVNKVKQASASAIDDTDILQVVDDNGDDNTAIAKHDSGDGASGSSCRSNNLKKRPMVDDVEIGSSVDVDTMDVVKEVVEENEVKRIRKD